MFKKRIYLDYASLTPIDPRVVREMGKFSASAYANPSSLYKEGVTAKKVLAEMRKKVADLIHAHADEIVFTSGGTESNALVLEGVGRAAHRNGIAKPHIIISSIEHSSIIETAHMLEKHGCEITRLSVDRAGVVSVEELKKALKPTTVLVSIMMVNNEIGSIQPIKEIAKVVRQARAGKDAAKADAYPLFHTDAAQGFLYEELFVEKLGVDFMTLDGSKVYGPRGIGCLFMKRGAPIEPIMYGGGQEKGMRSGTENLPSIAGFTKALEIAAGERTKEAARIADLRADFVNMIHMHKPAVTVNGSGSPHILNISIPGVDNEFLLFQLDAHGIACSTKSSCLRDEEESYVLKAIGANSAHSLRFSFGRFTKKADIKAAVKALLALI
jgi:cysteine desulfurase